jgi:hypothetical protein
MRSRSQSAVYVRKAFTIGTPCVQSWASNVTETVLDRVATWVKPASRYCTAHDLIGQIPTAGSGAG